MPAFSSVASSWLKTRNSRLGPCAARQRRQVHSRERAAAGLLNREDVAALLLELPAEPRLAIGDVNAFDDLAARVPSLHLYSISEEEDPRLILHN
jgi:hypothetical protein